MNTQFKNGLLLVVALAIIGAVTVTAWRMAYAPQSVVISEGGEMIAPAELPPAMDAAEVEPVPPALEPVASADTCFVGGCSNQVCTDDPEIMTTCEWREEYACYAGATCERQASGECSWTETAELSSCLMAAETSLELDLEVVAE